MGFLNSSYVLWGSGFVVPHWIPDYISWFLVLVYESEVFMRNKYVIFTCFEYVGVYVSEKEFFDYINRLKDSFVLGSVRYDDNLRRQSYYFIDSDGFESLVGNVYYD